MDITDADREWGPEWVRAKSLARDAWEIPVIQQLMASRHETVRERLEWLAQASRWATALADRARVERGLPPVYSAAGEPPPDWFYSETGLPPLSAPDPSAPPARRDPR